MNFIIENWYLIIAALAVIAVAVFAVIKFFKGNKEEHLTKIREWLVYATSIAEKEFGGGTGTLKLRYVYDMFVVKFPWLVKLISFEKFSDLVDEALVKLKELLSTNTAVKKIIEPSTEDKEN